MSKNTGPKRVKLADFKDRKAKEGAIEIEADDGNVYTVPPPELWPDEVMGLLAREQIVEAAQAIMGDGYELFVAAGGSANLLMALIKDEHQVDVGE